MPSHARTRMKAVSPGGFRDSLGVVGGRLWTPLLIPKRMVTLKIRKASYFFGKNGFIWEEQRAEVGTSKVWQIPSKSKEERNVMEEEEEVGMGGSEGKSTGEEPGLRVMRVSHWLSCGDGQVPAEDAGYVVFCGGTRPRSPSWAILLWKFVIDQAACSCCKWQSLPF